MSLVNRLNRPGQSARDRSRTLILETGFVLRSAECVGHHHFSPVVIGESTSFLPPRLKVQGACSTHTHACAVLHRPLAPTFYQRSRRVDQIVMIDKYGH